MAKLSTLDAMKLALEHHRAGNFAAAEQIYRKVLVHDANHADALHLLGFLLRQTGRVRTGIDLLQRAVDVNPNIAQFRNHLGQAMRDLGRGEEAVEMFRSAVHLDPNYAEAHNNLGAALHDLRHFPQAIVAYRKAIALDPNLPDAHSNLAQALLDLGRLDEAAGECRAAIRLYPNFVEAYVNLGNILSEQGEIDEAIEQYRRAVAIDPQLQIAWDNLLYKLHMSPRYDAAALLAEHRTWYQRCVQPLVQQPAAHSNLRDPERKLRVGYVSTDFREHPVGRFLVPLLEHHDREGSDVVCFADGVVVDDYTQRLKSYASVWHATSHLNDVELADMVRGEHVDVLVDLRVHSSPNRLLMFARKPAPVQITYLAYPGTTGLPMMDYRLTDAFLDPPGGEMFYAEQSLPLEGTYWCYEPHPATPDVTPRKGGEAVVFGNLNAFVKTTEDVLSLWRELLLAVDRSVLLMHALPGAHRDRVKNFFAQGNVDPRRVDFVGRQSLVDYLKTYERIDIALDPFPFSGGTTTCDALYMGVPVVTLAGATAVGREGVSILNRAACGDWVARSRSEYLSIAATLAGDVAGLANVRGMLREKLRRSSLMDGAGYAKGVEAAYRIAWRQWCEKR